MSNLLNHISVACSAVLGKVVTLETDGIKLKGCLIAMRQCIVIGMGQR